MANQHERHTSFHEKWYLVENLRPCLRHSVQTRRQRYWGDLWFVLTDLDNNSHYRLAQEAYAFVALLDGQRTVDEAWNQSQACRREYAMTQGEVIALLGNLHNANLISLDMLADTGSLLRRKQKSRLRKLTSTLSSFLFLRFPLLTPDAFFSRYQKIGGFPFSPFGIALWFVLLILAGHSLIARWDMFMEEMRLSLSPSNILWVYAVLIFTKTIHECAHAFACKYYSMRDGFAGDVQQMGIMLLVLVPMPYIDVSSSVQIRNKWQRAMVALAGIYAELFVAFVATLIWSHTMVSSALHLTALNCMLVASVGTILFNANPLLRFDGYYILSDILGMPNLYQRSQTYIKYLVKRYGLGIAAASTVVKRKNERILYPFYAILAFLYRIIIVVGIYIILEERLYNLGAVLALSLLFLWFGVPLIKGVYYLFTSQELNGRRMRSLSRAGLFISIIGTFFLAVPVSDEIITEAIVECRQVYGIYAQTEGPLKSFLPTDTIVDVGETLVCIADEELKIRYKDAEIEFTIAQSRLDKAYSAGDANAVALAKSKVEGSLSELSVLEEQMALRNITAPSQGIWIAPDLGSRQGKWIYKGDALGLVYEQKDMRLRAVVDQSDAARLFSESIIASEGIPTGASWQTASLPLMLENTPSAAGRRSLFHDALSQNAGGILPANPNASGQLEAVNRFFEVRFLPLLEETSLNAFSHGLYPGQRWQIRLSFEDSPLGLQYWRRIRQLFTRR
ncbi:MAG: M50 family metallopeptidase [Pseudomonadota bacterium]